MPELRRNNRKGGHNFKRLLNHLRDTTSKVGGIEFKDIYFPKGKEEIIVVMMCVSENKYMEWREVCPPPAGTKDWHEILLTKDEYMRQYLVY